MYKVIIWDDIFEEEIIVNDVLSVEFMSIIDVAIVTLIDGTQYMFEANEVLSIESY